MCEAGDRERADSAVNVVHRCFTEEGILLGARVSKAARQLKRLSWLGN